MLPFQLIDSEHFLGQERREKMWLLMVQMMWDTRATIRHLLPICGGAHFTVFITVITKEEGRTKERAVCMITLGLVLERECTVRSLSVDGTHERILSTARGYFRLRSHEISHWPDGRQPSQLLEGRFDICRQVEAPSRGVGDCCLPFFSFLVCGCFQGL